MYKLPFLAEIANDHFNFSVVAAEGYPMAESLFIYSDPASSSGVSIKGEATITTPDGISSYNVEGLMLTEIDIIF